MCVVSPQEEFCYTTQLASEQGQDRPEGKLGRSECRVLSVGHRRAAGAVQLGPCIEAGASAELSSALAGFRESFCGARLLGRTGFSRPGSLRPVCKQFVKQESNLGEKLKQTERSSVWVMAITDVARCELEFLRRKLTEGQILSKGL